MSSVITKEQASKYSNESLFASVYKKSWVLNYTGELSNQDYINDVNSLRVVLEEIKKRNLKVNPSIQTKEGSKVVTVDYILSLLPKTQTDPTKTTTASKLGLNQTEFYIILSGVLVLGIITAFTLIKRKK